MPSHVTVRRPHTFASPPEGRARAPQHSADDLAAIQVSLHELQEECAQRIDAARDVLHELRTTGSLSNADAQSELAVALHSIGEAERLEVEITAALARMDTGAFGVCRRCDRAIPMGRLELRPFERLCVQCSDRGPSRWS